MTCQPESNVPTSNITIVKNGTFVKNYIYTDNEDPPVPINLTGYTARSQMRASYGAASAFVDISTTPNSQGQINLGGSAGTVEVIVDEDHAATITQTSGVWDLLLIAPDGTVIPFVKGSVVIVPGVTVAP